MYITKYPLYNYVVMHFVELMYLSNVKNSPVNPVRSAQVLSV